MASKSGKTVENVVGKVWGFLDQLAESNPEEYQKFVSKAMEERREFLEPPLPVFCFSTGIRGVSDLSLASFPGSPLCTHMKTCKGRKMGSGELGKYCQVMMVDTTPLSASYTYVEREGGVASTQCLLSRDNIYQALAIFLPLASLACVRRGEPGDKANLSLWGSVGQVMDELV